MPLFQQSQDLKKLTDLISTESTVTVELGRKMNDDGSENVYLGFQFGLDSSTSKVLLYDCTAINDDSLIQQCMSEMFLSRHLCIYCHDVYRLKKQYKIATSNHDNVIDTQLVMEYLHDRPFYNTLEDAVAILKMNNSLTLSGRLSIISTIIVKLLDKNDVKHKLLLQATKARISNHSDDHDVTFHTSKGYAMWSKELLHLLSPSDCYIFTQPSFHNEVEDLLALLPPSIQEQIMTLRVTALTEIAMDYGRPATCWIDGQRHYFLSDSANQPDNTTSLTTTDEKYYVTSMSDLDIIVRGLGTFGSDNRSGIEKSLHRISCLRNRDAKIVGLTLRVGRHIDGIASILADLLLGQSQSILVLGEPGSGKTTVIRDIARILSSQYNVVIVDTSNEIGGDGDIPHSCIGTARRMMVTNLSDQGRVMIECVQNHTPQVMIIDEIGRPQEVEAARTCKQRGVRMISSAHGNLKSLMKNAQLKGLIGGITVVTLGDRLAKKSSETGTVNKLKSERQGEPVFDVIIELSRANTHIWTVIPNTATAVDSILNGKPYFAQHRSRDPKTNTYSMSLDKVV